MKIKQLLSLTFIIMMLASCNKKDDFNYPPGTVGSSRITYFPTMTLQGEDYVAVPVGSTFTDPGVDAEAAGETIQYTTDGTVDTNTPGVYTLTYTAFNKDGFSASVSRYVAVYSTDASAQDNDFSGTYLRAATGASSTWVKLAPGVYKVDNPGGAVGVNLVVFTFNPTGNVIHIPTQISNDGNTTTSSDEVYTPGTPASYVIKIINPGYGTGLRSFVKQ